MITKVETVISSLVPYVKDRNDFYNYTFVDGKTPKQKLDDVIYGSNTPTRGSYYCYFANRA